MTPQGELLAKVLALASDTTVDVPRLMEAVAKCVLQEREECAKEAEAVRKTYCQNIHPNAKEVRETYCPDCIAMAIRRRQSGVGTK